MYKLAVFDNIQIENRTTCYLTSTTEYIILYDEMFLQPSEYRWDQFSDCDIVLRGGGAASAPWSHTGLPTATAIVDEVGGVARSALPSALGAVLIVTPVLVQTDDLILQAGCCSGGACYVYDSHSLPIFRLMILPTFLQHSTDANVPLGRVGNHSRQKARAMLPNVNALRKMAGHPNGSQSALSTPPV